MRRLQRPIFLSIFVIVFFSFGLTACNRRSANNDASAQKQNPQQGQQDTADSQAVPKGGGPVPEPAQATGGIPSAASDEGSSTATKGLPLAQPGAPVGTAPEGSEANPRQPAKPPLTVPPGTTLSMRLNQRVSVLTSREGDLFTARLISPIETEGRTRIPAGATVAGVILHIRSSGHKGVSVLKLTLSGLNVREQHYQFRTSVPSRFRERQEEGAGDSGKTLANLVEGTGSQETGLIFGSLTGTKNGTVTAAFTGTKDIDYPTESLISFHLTAPLLLQP